MHKLLLLAFAAVMGVSGLSYAQSQPETKPCELSRSGCCSHHGGVCGCTGTMYQCCDGAASPTCECNSKKPLGLTPLINQQDANKAVKKEAS